MLNSWGIEVKETLVGEGSGNPVSLSESVSTSAYSCRVTTLSKLGAWPESQPFEVADLDQDGIQDSVDNCPQVANSEQGDNDLDDQGDLCDADDDNDGFDDIVDDFPFDASESLDSDGDGIGNNADADDDGDGVADADDAFPLDASETIDTDGDGIGNNADSDDDGDGVVDTEDAYPLDPTESADTDSDGIGDNEDAFPLDPNEAIDTDNDGIGNNADTDDDGDGLSDGDESLRGTDPLDSDTDGDGRTDSYDDLPLDPSESSDRDGDGVGDYADSDDDGDGIPDSSDLFPSAAYSTPILDVNLVEAGIGIVEILDSAVEEPANRIGAEGAAWILNGNGSYQAASEIQYDGPVVSQSGTWTSLSNGYVLTGEARGYYPTISCDGSVYHNLNCDYVEAVGFRQWETVQIPTVRMGVVETGPDVWRLAISYETTTYAESTGLALDPGNCDFVGEVKVIDVLPADILDRSSLPFTVSERWVRGRLISLTGTVLTLLHIVRVELVAI